MMLHQPGEAAVRTITMMGGGGNGDDGKRTCWVTMNVPASSTGRVCVCVCVCCRYEGQALCKERFALNRLEREEEFFFIAMKKDNIINGITVWKEPTVSSLIFLSVSAPPKP